MMAYLYIVFSAICSVLIAHLLKVTEVRKLRTLPTLTSNYCFAGLFAFIIGLSKTGHLPFLRSSFVLLFALVLGALFIGNFLMYSKSVHKNGVGVTIAAMRISLLIPVLASTYLYREAIGWSATAGIILVLGALMLLIPRKKGIRLGKMHAGWLLLFIFFVTGFADASLKIYQEEWSGQLDELIFMSLVFGGAFLIGFGLMVFSERPLITKKEAGMGCLIGIPNLYSSVFLIYALKDIEGAIAFSLVNILNVAAGTALGLLWWNDKITTWQWIGLSIAIFAIILLV